jgi:hypothetical protein
VRRQRGGKEEVRRSKKGAERKAERKERSRGRGRRDKI